MATMGDARVMLKAFRQVRRLHFVALSVEEDDEDSDEEDSEELELDVSCQEYATPTTSHLNLAPA
jgi:hypothetical protein